MVGATGSEGCIRDKCWSRRSRLACCREQVQRVESANAVQRRGAVEHPRSKEREECASGRLAYARCAQVGETEHVLAAGVLHIHIYRSRTEVCLTSMSDAVCVDNNGKQQ